MNKPGMSKISSTRAVNIAGLVNGEVQTLPLICVRKSCVRDRPSPEADQIVSGQYEVLGMVSHPSLYKSRTAQYVKAWCHCYKNPDEYIPADKPKILLSESDFVDPSYIKMVPPQSPRFDFFCFTMGNVKCSRRKGVDLLVRILPEIVKNKRKIVIVNYNHKQFPFNKRQKRIWRDCSHAIHYIERKLLPEEVAEIMAQSRFGLFPNEIDCSPLLISESLLRGKPVLVNQNILGGWKYVNDQTGSFFTADSIETDIDRMYSNTFHTRDFFMKDYGFENSARRLAEFGRQHFESFKDCEKACFSGLSHLLKK